MPNPIILIQNAGFGETPVPADALLTPGQTLTINDENDGSRSDAKVLAVVPGRACIEYAIADQNGQPRPLMISENHSRQTLYVIEHNGRQLRILQKQMAKGLAAAKAAGLE